MHKCALIHAKSQTHAVSVFSCFFFHFVCFKWVLTNRSHLAVAVYVRCYGEGCLLEKDRFLHSVQTICFVWHLVSTSQTENRPEPCKRDHLRIGLNKSPRGRGSVIQPADTVEQHVNPQIAFERQFSFGVRNPNAFSLGSVEMSLSFGF